MEVCMDFLNCLDLDTLEKILMYLEEPSDIVRVSAVSQSWRDFGELKQLHVYNFASFNSIVYRLIVFLMLQQQQCVFVVDPFIIKVTKFSLAVNLIAIAWSWLWTKYMTLNIDTGGVFSNATQTQFILTQVIKNRSLVELLVVNGTIWGKMVGIDTRK